MNPNVEILVANLQASLRGEMPPASDTPEQEALMAAAKAIHGNDDAMRTMGALALSALIGHWREAMAARRELLLLQIAVANGQSPGQH